MQSSPDLKGRIYRLAWASAQETWMLKMVNSQRWKAHTLFGLIGMGLTAYVTYTVLGLRPQLQTEIWVFGGLAAAFAVGTVFHFLAAYAYRFGQVDEVRGHRQSAVLLRGGAIVKAGARIWIANNADKGNVQLRPEQQAVLLMVGGMPYVCSRSGYRIL